MALSQVVFTGYPAAAWKNLTSASTDGKSYALNADNATVLPAWSGRCSSWVGTRAMRHNLEDEDSLQPLKIGTP